MRSLLILTLVTILSYASAEGSTRPVGTHPALHISYAPQNTILDILKNPSLLIDTANVTHVFNITQYHLTHMKGLQQQLQTAGRPHTLWLPDDHAMAEAKPRWEQYLKEKYNFTDVDINRTWIGTEQNSTIRSVVMAYTHAGIMWSITQGNISLTDLKQDNLFHTMLNETQFVQLGKNQTTGAGTYQKMRVIKGDEFKVFGKSIPMSHTNRTDVMLISGSGQYPWQYGHVYRQIIAKNGIIYLLDRAVDMPRNVTDTLKTENATLFLRGVAKAQLNDTINNTPNITVFVPTDEAIKNAMRDYQKGKPAEQKWSQEQLKAIMMGYIVNGTYYAQDLNTTTPPTLKSLSGDTTHPITRSPTGELLLYKNISVVAANVLTRNGVIHFINDTLREIDMKKIPRT